MPLLCNSECRARICTWHRRWIASVSGIRCLQALDTVQKSLQNPKVLPPLHMANEQHSLQYLTTLAAEMLNIDCMLCAGMGQCVGGGSRL